MRQHTEDIQHADKRQAVLAPAQGSVDHRHDPQEQCLGHLQAGELNKRTSLGQLYTEPRRMYISAVHFIKYLWRIEVRSSVAVRGSSNMKNAAAKDDPSLADGWVQ